MYEKLERFIEAMPSLPLTVSKVLEVCNNPKTSPADLNKVISLDPVLMGKVLKLINAAYYGTNQQITSLVRAMIMLGVNTVKNLALSTAVLGTFSKSEYQTRLDMSGFWRHSLCVGVTAKLLAQRRGIDRKQWEDYFCVGLLHDIGKIPLDALLAGDYLHAIACADKEKKPFFRIEDRLFNINHCQTGQMITELWKLDGAVRDVIIHHHNTSAYNGPYKDELFTVVAVNRYVNISRLGFSGDPYPEQFDDIVLEALQIKKNIFFEMEEEILKELEKAQSFLQISS